MNGIYYVSGIPYSAELCHHGIKGQKWGVRRYQNEDGSLTDAGRKRLAKTLSSNRQYKKLMSSRANRDTFVDDTLRKASKELNNSKEFKNYDRVDKQVVKDTYKYLNNPNNRKIEKRMAMNSYKREELYTKLNKKAQAIVNKYLGDYSKKSIRRIRYESAFTLGQRAVQLIEYMGDSK